MKLVLKANGVRVPEWTYREVTDEVSRLELVYPDNDAFTEEEIADATKHLSDYQLTKDVVSYTGEAFTPAQLVTFAKFAEALDKNAEITHDYNGIKIKRQTTPEERREAALSKLRADVGDRNRKTAEQSLTDRFEAGELPDLKFDTEVDY
jgi:hypothetical protein